MKHSRGFSKGLLALLTLFVFNSLGSSQAQELKKSGRYFVAEIDRSFKVGKTGNLHIFDIRGDVEVSAWEKREVHVMEVKKIDAFTRKEAETVLQKSKSNYRQEGDNIEIGGEYFSRHGVHSDFKVQVPAGFNIDIQTRGGNVSATGLNGSVEMRTSGGDIELKDMGGVINAKTSGGDISLKNCSNVISVKTSGGDLRLLDIGGELRAKTSGGNISLDRANAGVELYTSGGSIELSHVKGTARAHTSGGDIQVMSVNGDVEVSTSGGDIEFRDVGGRLDASTSGGDIDGENASGSVTVATSGGSLRLKDIRGGVQGKTSGGDIDVEVTLKDFSKRHAIDLATAGGEITLYLPEKIPARIQAEIRLTDRWEDYNIYSDFPLKSSEQGEEEGGKKSRWHRARRYVTAEGEINGGGDLIELSTTNGDIRIKKSKP